MSMVADPQQELEDLGHRFGERGYRFRCAPFFGASGIWIFVPPDGQGEIAVIEKSVFIYARYGRWEARVTQHGGPHWIRQADTIPALQEVALEGLTSSVLPPTAAWERDWLAPSIGS